jgi:uncharacterized glyoxalase superfamily protein PhnB
VKQYAAKLGLSGLAPHDLRRSCARLCHSAGGELEQIQFLLGHVSVQTTERYLGCKQRIRGAVNDRIGIGPWATNRQVDGKRCAVNHERSTETYGLDSTPLIPGPSKPRARWCYDEPNNPMTFPAPVPEIPAANVDKAAAYYVNTLGFTFDWGDDQGGIAGISRGNCRLFITNRSFRESYGNIGPILFWLNLDSKAEVDELFAQWKAAQAKIVSEPEDKPWKLREFMAADLDGNLIRVFYDFRGDM